MKYIDPDGRVDVTPRYFTQEEWNESHVFDKKFSSNACAATSIVNVISTVYTKETGKKLTFEQGVNILNEAVSNRYISSKNAFVNDWEKAANSMGNSLHLLGSFKSNENNPQFLIYAFASKTDTSQPGHFSFVINKDTGQYIDSNGGKIKNFYLYNLFIDKPFCRKLFITRKLQDERPFRGFDYIID